MKKLKTQLLSFLHEKNYQAFLDFYLKNKEMFIDVFKEDNYFAADLGKFYIPSIDNKIFDMEQLFPCHLNENFYKGIYYFAYQIKDLVKTNSEKTLQLVQAFDKLVGIIEYPNVSQSTKDYLCQKISSIYKYNYNDNSVTKNLSKEVLDKWYESYNNFLIKNPSQINWYNIFESDAGTIVKSLEIVKEKIDSLYYGSSTTLLSRYLYNFSTSNKIINKIVLKKFKEFGANPNKGGYKDNQPYLCLIKNPKNLMIFFEIFLDQIDFSLNNPQGNNFLKLFVQEINSEFKITQNLGKTIDKYNEVIEFLLQHDKFDLSVRSGMKEKGNPLATYIKKYCEPEIASILLDKIVLYNDFIKKDKNIENKKRFTNKI